MTRIDEIYQAAEKEFPSWEDHCCGFLQGAKWADQNPAPNLVDIGKACEICSEMLLRIDTSLFKRKLNRSQYINELESGYQYFKQAMKGE